ncbi:MAG: cation:proton antiporter, partial [Bacteroidales bacterium]
ENQITDVVVGFHHKANIADTFFGHTTQNILRRTNKMLLIVKGLTPINTINKMVIAVPAKAEYETGFDRWVDRIANIATQMGCRTIFYSDEATEACLKSLIRIKKYRFRTEFEPLSDWNDFIALKDVVHQHDLFVVISARHTSVSYHHS